MTTTHSPSRPVIVCSIALILPDLKHYMNQMTTHELSINELVSWVHTYLRDGNQYPQSLSTILDIADEALERNTPDLNIPEELRREVLQTDTTLLKRILTELYHHYHLVLRSSGAYDENNILQYSNPVLTGLGDVYLYP